MRFSSLTICCALLWGALGVMADPPQAPEAYQKAMVDARAAAEERNASVVRGREGWLFFTPELRTLTIGPFWGEQAAKVSKAAQPADADPLPAILDFHEQLRKAGIELLLVPVPAKATIYPDYLTDGLPAMPTPPVRSDGTQEAFYALLREKGIAVLDLTPIFLGKRQQDDAPLYCKQDSHWSPRGCAVAAWEIANLVKARPWAKKAATHTYTFAPSKTALTGDLWQMLGDATLAKETVSLTTVKERTKTGNVAVTSWRESPLVLLGDSHNLVFSIGGDMLIQGAGLPELLALRLGFPADVVAVRGSGATPARINLLRRRDNLAGKRMVVWCFTVREFTEGQGWKKVPVIR